MAIVIQTKKPEVPIEFKDDQGKIIETFIFDKSDDAAKVIVQVENKVLKAIALGELKGDAYSTDDLLNDIKPLVNQMLGEDAFDRLYKLAGSWEIFMYYYVQICAGIREETNSNFGTMESLLNDYLNK